jgi:formylglycine-generating enzyme required for sulfatase activity
MVVIPPGKFTMGAKSTVDGQDYSPNPSGNAPAKVVDFDTAFAAGRYDVSRDEYAAFIHDAGRRSEDGCYVWNGEYWIEDPDKSWRNPSFKQSGRDPVVCVSWEDAQAYVRWLNAKLNSTSYRLLTWEESEYVAAAGTSTRYYWGDEPRRDAANYGKDKCNPCKPWTSGADRWPNTSPGGSFPPNSFGLYDTAGNVWQWTSTCWPDFPTADQWCRFGAVRGGSWLTHPDYLRTAEYWANDRLNHNSTVGFRVARTLSNTPVADAAVPSSTSPAPTDIPAPSPSSAPSSSLSHHQGSQFRDCPNCPIMTVLPPGHFILSVPAPEWPGGPETKGADHPIRIAIKKPFAVALYDVTRDEYAAYTKQTERPKGSGCQIYDGHRWALDNDTDWIHPGFHQTGREPVVCVSWDDAQAYVSWLNAQIGRPQNGPYRLPSGEEWEYAARGGHLTQAPYYWGHQLNHDKANYGLDQCFPCGIEKHGNDHWYYTSPVGSFRPNSFGLYDMSGNVWQWTDDCYSDTMATAPADASAWTSGDCRFRILRGGSYNDMQLFLQLTPHNWFPPDLRNNANGFRVVRDLD